ncbi:MAG: hypothetical protein L6290_10805 [Thermodesulfovibrionales bacterium]|nr:hypothetical protein [Thermodesulfovibrionales bacterium]
MLETQIKALETESKTRIEILEQQKAAGKNIPHIDAVIVEENAQTETQIKELKATLPKPVFPMKNPAIFSMGLAFLVGILVSLVSPEKKAEEKFEDEKVRTYVGLGAE